MLTLILLRHAKSSWEDLRLDDFDRPLSKRGAKAAPEVGQHLAKRKLKPDLVLCSSAVRTRGTLALVVPELGAPPPEIRYDDDLYLAPPRMMLDKLHALDAEATRPAAVMFVGHNPGTHALALEMVGAGDRKAMAQMATKFPTAALAVITFEAEKWSNARPATGRLVEFVTPRDLD